MTQSTARYMQRMYVSLVYVLSFLFIGALLVPIVNAQSEDVAEVNRVEDNAPEGLSSCFEYYRFGSVPVEISGMVRETSPGAALGLTGTISNENPYPLVNVSVIAKLFKVRNGGEKDANGPDVLDVSTVVHDITLKSNETQPLSFIVPIPENAEPGKYQIATYVVSMDRFNMLGLSFTDDIIGGIFDVEVVGTPRGAVRFDKASVTVMNEAYRFAAYPSRIPKGESNVPVSVRIVNTTESPVKGTVTWKLYAWDALRADKLIEEKTESIKLFSGGEATARYNVTDTSHSVYYLVGELKTHEGKVSHIGVRFVRTDVFEPRINFVGISEYPTTDSSVAFACLHSTGMEAAEDGEIQLSVTRNDAFSRFFGKETIMTTYRGVVPGEVSALSLPTGILSSSFEVSAKLLQNGKTIDTVSVAYNCEVLGVPCENPSLWSDIYAHYRIFVWAAGATFLLLVMLGALVFKRKSKANMYVQL